jgi:hypothetical protein
VAVMCLGFGAGMEVSRKGIFGLCWVGEEGDCTCIFRRHVGEILGAEKMVGWL